MPTILGALASANLALLTRLLPHIEPAHRSGMARRLMEDRHNPRTKILAAFFDRGLMAWRNKNYEINVNGEEALLRRLAPFAPKVMIDVGANEGEWSLAACRHLPGAAVHAFEIAPATANILERRTAPMGQRIVVNRTGLSDHEGETEIWFSPENNTQTSTLREAFAIGEELHSFSTVEHMLVPIITGDAYLAARGIDQVDLLKIDVEGAEPAVLRGFENAFARNAITMVQFEYGTINAATRFLLADFYAFFEARGFAIGKLWPEGVAFTGYTPADEDFIGPNFVACLRSRSDIINALACTPLTFD